MLVGLSAKNAILIVEFARELEFAGRTPVQAAIEASRLRLRPILMTSLAFIMGVLPLVLSTGAGAEMRQAMGVAVFAGMIGVTAFGIFLTPVFYVLLRALTGNRPLKQHGESTVEAGAPALAERRLTSRLRGVSDRRVAQALDREDAEDLVADLDGGARLLLGSSCAQVQPGFRNRVTGHGHVVVMQDGRLARLDANPIVVHRILPVTD